MNLVDVIKDQLSGEVTNKLGSLTGGSEEQTKSALGAAVPAILSALSRLASSGGKGADALASVLNKFGGGSMGNLAGDPQQAAEQGQSVLGSLFGGSTVAALAGALAKFVGLDSGIIKKVLAFATPFVLGSIAKQFHGKPATPQGVANLFAEQDENIADAMPEGFSLPNVPGLSDIGSAVDNVTAGARKTAGQAQAAGSSFMKTLLPIAGLAFLAFLGWQFMKGRADKPPMKEVSGPIEHVVMKPVTDLPNSLPDVARVSDDLKSVYTTATTTLKGVTDVASAQAALPKLSELSKQIDGIAALKDKLPDSARSALSKIATDGIGQLRELIEKVLSIPGVREKLEPTLNGILSKLKTFEQKA